MKIHILIPLWKRPEVTKFCFDGLEKLRSEIEYETEVSCVISEEFYKAECDSRGYHWIEHENDPLGRKINAGVRSTLAYQYDYLMIMNSDNVIKKELLEVYRPFFESMNPFFGVQRVTYVNFKTLEARDYLYEFSVLGIAKMVSRETVERFKGELYDNNRNKGLDDSMMDKMIRGDVSPTFVQYEGQLCFDYKSEVNIHPWEKFEQRGKKVCYSPG